MPNKMKDPIIGYVYDKNGNYEYKYYFERSPKNIAAFIMQNAEHDCCITNSVDVFICSSMMGGFLDRIGDPSGSFRSELMKELIPLQSGTKELEPIEFYFCPEDQCYIQMGYAFL